MPNYTQDPDDEKKVGPGSLPDNYYGNASVPANGTFNRRPNAIMVNASNGTIGFYLGSSASFATAVVTNVPPITASSHYVSFGTPNEGTVLNIHPIAWSGSATDSVTFIYKGGLDGGSV